MSDDYPLFIPPGDLGERTPREWSRAEATAYAGWLQSCIPQRTRQLLCYFGLDDTRSSVSLLDPLGRRVADALLRGPFSADGQPTNHGYALAADMGLLLATILQQENPGLMWDIVRKPKSDWSYNNPVLVGFCDGVPFDPVQISISQAFSVLAGTKDGTAWRQVFDYWDARAKGR